MDAGQKSKTAPHRKEAPGAHKASPHKTVLLADGIFVVPFVGAVLPQPESQTARSPTKDPGLGVAPELVQDTHLAGLIVPCDRVMDCRKKVRGGAFWTERRRSALLTLPTAVPRQNGLPEPCVGQGGPVWKGSGQPSSK